MFCPPRRLVVSIRHENDRFVAEVTITPEQKSTQLPPVCLGASTFGALLTELVRWIHEARVFDAPTPPGNLPPEDPPPRVCRVWLDRSEFPV